MTHLPYLLLLLGAFAEGRPLYYWGARPPVILVETGAERPAEARVLEVHAAVDKGELLLRFTFDRPVREALYLPDGRPVSGRLRAVLYVDADDDRSSGVDQGPKDLRTGAERRIEIGAVTLGEDPEEKRGASALVTATLVSLSRDGRRRTLWRGDDSKAGEVSAHGEWVEVRMPADRVGIESAARLILAEGDRAWEGRFQP